MYGRTLGRVYVGDKDINLEMVKSGWAIPYIICEGESCDENFFERENVAEYLQACHSARAQGLGIFNPANPLTEMPFEFRLRIQKREANKYIGDVTTIQLFAPADYNQVDVCNRVFFMTMDAGANLGFNELVF